MKVFRCSVCFCWVPDWCAYRFRGRTFCTDDLPSEGWDAALDVRREG